MVHREASPFLAGECIRGGPGTGVADPAEPVHSVQADQGGGGPAAGSRAEDLLQTGQCCCKKPSRDMTDIPSDVWEPSILMYLRDFRRGREILAKG